MLRTIIAAVAFWVLVSISAYAVTPTVKVYLSTDQAIQGNTPTTVEYDTEIFDVGDHFDTSTHEWTPPAGIYRITAIVEYMDTGAIVGELLWLLIERGSSDRAAVFDRRVDTSAQSVMITGLVEVDGTQPISINARKGNTADGKLHGTASSVLFMGEKID